MQVDQGSYTSERANHLYLENRRMAPGVCGNGSVPLRLGGVLKLKQNAKKSFLSLFLTLINPFS